MREHNLLCFVSAQGLIPVLFKTTQSQATWPRRLCTSLHKSGTSTYSPHFHFNYSLTALPREILGARFCWAGLHLV